MKKIIAGNWKFNKELRDLDKATKYIESLEEKIGRFKNVEVKIFPHNSILPQLAKRVKKIKIGSQDIHWEEDGSFTGAQFSVKNLLSIGVRETLIGHSETRFYFGVTDEKVALKLKAAFKTESRASARNEVQDESESFIGNESRAKQGASKDENEVLIANGIIPTICIGEDIEEKEKGRTKEVLERQIKEGILPVCNDFRSNAFIIAYEPVYAIAGFAKMRGMEPKPPKIGDIKYAFETIREIFSENGYPKIKILYGGSSNEKNAGELLALSFIDGLLPGTASWNLDSFFEMIKIAEEICAR